MELTPVAPAIGAVASGVDLSQPLTADTLAGLHRALAEHLVLFFPAQDLGHVRLAALGSELGDICHYPFAAQQDVIHVTKEPDEQVNFGGIWHSDTPYLPRPAGAALLYAKEVPESGGDTLFANMYLAYEALSRGLQRLLQTLDGVNDAGQQAIAATRGSQETASSYRARHPVVRRHPVTGKPLLYVSKAHTSHFHGWSTAESGPLLDHLFSVQTRAEYTCRFRWQQGDLALWDNRACQHYPLNDYHGQRRDMLRVSLAGEVPQRWHDDTNDTD